MSALRSLSLAGSLLMLWLAQCTFPEYETVKAGAGSGSDAGQGASGGSGAVGGTGGTSLGASAGAGADDMGGASGQAGAGAPGCPGEQYPFDRCEGGCL